MIRRLRPRRRRRRWPGSSPWPRRPAPSSGSRRGPTRPPPSTSRRRSLEEVRVDEQLGAQLPLDATFTDAAGQPVQLRAGLRAGQAGGAGAGLLRLPHALRPDHVRHGPRHARERPRGRPRLHRALHLLRARGEAGAGPRAAARLPAVDRARPSASERLALLGGPRRRRQARRRRRRLPLRARTAPPASGPTWPRSSSSPRTGRSRATSTASSSPPRTSASRWSRPPAAASAPASTSSSSPASATTRPPASTSPSPSACCAWAAALAVVALGGLIAGLVWRERRKARPTA